MRYLQANLKADQAIRDKKAKIKNRNPKGTVHYYVSTGMGNHLRKI